MHPCPGTAAVGSGKAEVAYLARGQQVVLPGKGAELLWAGGARCSEQGEAQSTESCGLCLAPFLLLPLAASLLHFKEHPQERFPGRRAAQWRLCGRAAFIAVRQTGRNSHFPPGCSPARRRQAWRTL